MELHNLKPAEGSTHNSKRVGRGYGSGKGRTATRGHKGAKARSGYKKKIGFEGGQMPLQRRVPKFGFKNINRVEYKAINLNIIQKLVDDKKLEKVGIAELLEKKQSTEHAACREKKLRALNIIKHRDLSRRICGADRRTGKTPLWKRSSFLPCWIMWRIPHFPL